LFSFIYYLRSRQAGIAAETEECIRLYRKSRRKTEEYKEILPEPLWYCCSDALSFCSMRIWEYKGLYRILQKDNAKAMEMPPSEIFRGPATVFTDGFSSL
jgi:hypothetical protein